MMQNNGKPISHYSPNVAVFSHLKRLASFAIALLNFPSTTNTASTPKANPPFSLRMATVCTTIAASAYRKNIGFTRTTGKRDGFWKSTMLNFVVYSFRELATPEYAKNCKRLNLILGGNTLC